MYDSDAAVRSARAMHKHVQKLRARFTPLNNRFLQPTANALREPARAPSGNDWRCAHEKNRDLRDRAHVHNRTHIAAAGSLCALSGVMVAGRGIGRKRRSQRSLVGRGTRGLVGNEWDRSPYAE